MVHAVRDNHPQLFEINERPAAEHQDELAHYELGSHGIVCLGTDDTVLWKHPGHNVSQQTLDAGVQEVLGALGRKQRR